MPPIQATIVVDAVPAGFVPGQYRIHHNPSGHIPEAAVATLPMPVFDRFAARRGIALHL